MIDNKAIVHKNTKIHKTATISAYAVIGSNVEIDAGTVVDSHTVIQNFTKIGKNNHIYSFASIGGDPQDLTYEAGQESNLIIGDNNLIREFCTINRGTEKENSITRIGSNNMLMAYVHIAHDCQLGDNIVMSNNSSLAGHVVLQNWVVLGGFTLVKQFCTIGAHSYIGMGCHINKDIPPYLAVAGIPTRIKSVNSVGLNRRGFSTHTISAIKRVFKIIYRESTYGLIGKKLDEIEKTESNNEEVMKFVEAIRNSKLGTMLSTTEE